MRRRHRRLLHVPPKHPDTKITHKISSITSPCGDSGVSTGSAVETPPTVCRVLTFDSQAEQSSASPPAAKCTHVSRSTELIKICIVCVCTCICTCMRGTGLGTRLTINHALCKFISQVQRGRRGVCVF